MNLKRGGHILNNFAAAMLCGTAMSLLAFCFEQIVALRIGHAATHLEETVSPQSYWQAILITVLVAPLIEEWGCTEFCVNGLMAGNRRTSRIGYDRKYKEISTQRPH